MLLPGEEYVVRYAVRFRETAYRVLCGSLIKSLQGIEISGLATLDQPMDCVAAGDEVDVAIRFRCMLRPGAYFVNTGVFGIVNGREGFLHRVTDGLMFRVMETGYRSTTGMVDLFLGAGLRRGKNEVKEAA
jgi:lipopolysaccharide transport system ATP-binding protein